MRRTALLMTLVTAFAALILAMAASASAANKNALTLHFTCGGGVTFTGTSIDQNQAVVVQVVEGDGGRTFVLTNITADDGTVFFNVSGFEDKETLACRIEEFPGAVFTGFFSPRSG
jgi:type 1 fimbria pilin